MVSGEVKLAKPDPRIFELAILRCGLTPESTVFIDDHAPNIHDGAEAGAARSALRASTRLARGPAAAGPAPLGPRSELQSHFALRNRQNSQLSMLTIAVNASG